ncbi:NUDIX domain-containing protein [Asticcacaulis sp. AND118]|uniref:NUDIX domain-containing protein n=1 Tax=Asticcacaulis sp. AND118 TaxID=2840468 RepID=UPI001CFFC75E|nr:NUDIX domain-containing protein [Asticcacaulis sp. AND118]UDF03411.1 NUDIX domain-containing protein [Asticcacaulis sp. AND118]
MTRDRQVRLAAGRFHPLTDDYLRALKDWRGGGEMIVVVIGANMSRSARYPFRAEEQFAMLQAAGFEAVAIEEALLPEARVRQLRAIVDGGPLLSFDVGYGGELKGLWTGDIVTADPVISRHAAAICSAWLQGVPFTGVSDAVRGLMQVDQDIHQALAEEDAYIAQYHQSWSVAPYPPVHVTVDALIRQDDRILLIKRGGLPGRGQWALPGGFLDPHETLVAAALRELREETGLFLSESQARQCLKGQRVFDQPERSARGRTLSHVCYFDLSGLELPPLEAGDDAAALKWTGVTCALKMRAHMFEDHYLMLQHFLSTDTAVTDWICREPMARDV